MFKSRQNYTNRDIQYLRSITIEEYDLKSAGFSILVEKKLLPEEELKALRRMNKKKLNITIGHIMRRSPQIVKEINNGLIEARNMFIEANDLSEDDILSVKRDAIFVINKNITHTKFGNYSFVLKNTYSSYVYLDKKEFYYSSRLDTIDVKGISDDVRERQNDYLISDIKNILRSAERLNQSQLFRQLKRYRSDYLNLRLPIDTYRSMESGFFKLGRFEIDVPPGEDLLEDLNYMENYINYIIPLIRLLV